MNDQQVENDFLCALEQEGVNAAIRLWPSFLYQEISASAGDPVQHLRCIVSASRIWILGRLNAEETLANLDERSLRYLRHNPSSLPPATRKALLDQLPDDAPEAPELLALCDELDGDELTRWLGAGTGPIAAERLWARPSAEILDVIKRLAGVDEEKTAALMDHCPDSQIEIALEALEQNPGVLSSERLRRWVRHHLANARHHATRLTAFIPHR